MGMSLNISDQTVKVGYHTMSLHEWNKICSLIELLRVEVCAKDFEVNLDSQHMRYYLYFTVNSDKLHRYNTPVEVSEAELTELIIEIKLKHF